MSTTLSQIKISATRYRGQDRKERAVLLWGDYEWLLGQAENKDALLRDLLATLEGLGYVKTARIDARYWAEHFRKQINKLNKNNEKNHRITKARHHRV
jgi:hypothetical protein